MEGKSKMSAQTDVERKSKKERNRNLTVPNAMSVFRILVIPVFVCFALADHIPGALIALGLSGLSDALDGFVARKFNQITELGKMLDPFADKLTQGAVAICIAVRYPSICPLLFLFVAKELLMRMDEEIWVTSRQGEGTQFYFTVRIAGEETPQPAQQ